MFKRIAIMAAASIVLSGCSEEHTTTRHYNYCDSDNALKVSDFVLQCVSAANADFDNSIADSEDIIEQCEDTGRRMFCPLYEHTVIMSCDGLGACYEIDRFVKDKK